MKTTLNWIELADHALKRAAQRAREVAWRTNTPLLVMRNGKIVKLIPGPEKGMFREEPPPPDTKRQSLE